MALPLSIIGVMLSFRDTDLPERLEFFKLLQSADGLLDNGDRLRVEVISVEDNHIERFVDLIKSKKVVSVVSFLNSAQMLKLKPYIESAKIPVIAAIATHSDINKINYVSRICLNNRLEANVAAAYLRDELLIPQVSVLSDKENIFALELSKFFSRRYRKLGGEIEHTFDTSFLKKYPNKFVKSLKKDAVETIYAVANADEIKILLELIHKEKLDIKILSYDGLLSAYKTQFPEDIALLDGVYVVDNYANDIVIGKRARALLQKSDLDVYTIDVDSYDALSYDAWALLKGALNACKKHDNTCVNEYMRNINPFDATSDSISMRDGNALRPVYVNEIRGEKMFIKVKVF